MRAFFAFVKRELLEAWRSGKLTILGILFVLFGIMNPAIAKLTPWMLEMLSDSLEENGMIVTAVTVNALTSWTQFFKNIPMALIVFVLIFGSSFTKEYESGTLVLLLTKGIARYKIVLAKAGTMLCLWSLGYWICFATTYAYNAYFWDNSEVSSLMTAVLNWWLFGVFTVALVVLFSTLVRGYSGVLLGTGATVFLFYLVGFLPKCARYMPTSLMSSTGLMIGTESAEDYLYTVVITALLSVGCILISIPVMHKKQI